MPFQKLIPVPEKTPFRCMLDSSTICPHFVAQGSGRGINRTIICKNREAQNGNGEYVGERYVWRAKKCLSERKKERA